MKGMVLYLNELDMRSLLFCVRFLAARSYAKQGRVMFQWEPIGSKLK